MPQETNYNSAFTGQQIDSAISSVRTNESSWGAKADKTVVHQVTLAAASWSNGSQTISVDGVKGAGIDQLIQIIPTKTDEEQYVSCGIECTTDAANTLTF